MIDLGWADAAGGLLFLRRAGIGAPTVLVALPDSEALWRVGIGEVTYSEALLPYVLGRLGDVVQGPDGSVFVATRNRDGRGIVAAGDDLLVRLTPQ